MKKFVALFVVLVMIVCCGCGTKAPAPTPTPTPEPTPEPTPTVIKMDCVVSEVLDADQQSFLETIRSNPPAVASVYLDGEFPETVVLDMDTVRSICSSLSGLKVSAEIMDVEGSGDNHVTLTRKNGENLRLNFIGQDLVSMGSYYSIENADEFFSTLRTICEKAAADAKANKAAMESQEFKTVSYSDSTQAWKMRLSYTPVDSVGLNEGGWQTVRTTLSLTNTGEHILMSTKLIAKYINADGYVVAENPVDIDFNACPIFLGECREYILDQKVYSPVGNTGDAATDVIFTIVNVNAPDEAGH